MHQLEEHLAFFYELGFAFNQWASLEVALFWCLSTCFPEKQWDNIYTGFSALEGFRSRLKFVSRVMQEHHKRQEWTEEWEKLTSRLNSLSTSRNKLAHWRVDRFPFEKAGRRYALCPWTSQERTKQEDPFIPSVPKGSLCIRDLNGMRLEFFSANMQLDHMRRRILGIQGADKITPSPSTKPRTLAQLRADLYTLTGADNPRTKR